MRLLKKIIAIVLVIAILWGVLYLGGYSFSSFFTSIGMRNPVDVFQQFFPTDDNTSTDDSSNSTVENSGQTGWFPDDMNFGNVVSTGKNVIVNVGGKIFNVTKDTIASFIKWLQQNYKEGDSITIEDVIDNTDDSNTSTNNSTSNSNTSNTSSNNSSSSSTTSTPEEIPTLVDYSKRELTSKAELQALINSIRIVDSLPANTDYNRDTFEKPVKSYKLDGKTVNRNDYAWKTSKYFDPVTFTYTCPYTGTVIKDLDDGKADNDFGNLDYDHLLPLSSAYIRGAKDWTKEQQNAYAYDQWVGVDVLYSANRSKGDKGPLEYMPPINQGSYCFSWFMIASKYNLAMTQAEVDLCANYINAALASGETIEFMCGYPT